MTTTVELIQGNGEDVVTLRLHPISVATLRPLASLGFDLYLQRNRSNEPTLYRQRSYPLTQEDIDRLVEAEVEALYITDLGCLRYEQYLQENLDHFIENQTTPLSIRFRFLHDAAKLAFKGSFRIIKVHRTVEAALKVGLQLTNLVCDCRLEPLGLFGMMRRDWQLFTHLTNVAGYAVLLAQRLGISDQALLEEVAVGALLHDVGMRHVPAVLFQKETPLSQREQDLIRRHPQAGYEELCKVPDLTVGQLMMAYQHHERIDGSGYPVRVTGDEIHWMAKLCSVVDAFNTMTCPQPHRKALDPDGVIEHLRENAGTLYDKEMVRCWTT